MFAIESQAMRITLLTQAVAIVGGLISLGFLVNSADYAALISINDGFGPDVVDRFVGTTLTIIAIPTTLLIHVWVTLPFALVFQHAPKLSLSRAASLLSLLMAILLASSSTYFYWGSLFKASTLDPQSGLIMLSLPFCQVAAFLILRELCNLVAHSLSNEKKSCRQ